MEDLGNPQSTAASNEANDANKSKTLPIAGFEHPRRRATDRLPKSQSDSLSALVTAMRWGTTTVGLLWAAALGIEGSQLLWGTALLAYSMWRTWKPVEYGRRGWRSLISIISELAISAIAVASTECWDSPYIFTLFTPVIAAGFARGFGHALRIALTATVAIGLVAWMQDLETGIRPITSWGGELLLVAGVASYGRRLLTKAEEVRAQNLNQVWRLNEANALLVSLNRLAHDLPVSFDFDETLRATLDRVRDTTNPDTAALLLLDPLSPHWNVAISEGVRLPEILNNEQLPSAVREVARQTEAKLICDLSKDNPGLSETSQCGIYVPLWTGVKQVGLIAVESPIATHLTSQQVALLQEMAEPVALTIDNARWFERLRARGAAQERNRIARDLHDRVGQGVAYVAFELDRLAVSAESSELSEDLNRLRTDARSIVHELRETLYDLRTDVSDENDLIKTITEFLDRVGNRSTIETSFAYNATRRLPLAQERELWRICQEAIINAERHAEAGVITVCWTVDDEGGILEVTDDGVGLQQSDEDADGAITGYGESATPGRPSYGLTGMRERADAIGALLEVEAAAEGGTVVRATVGRRLIQQSQQQERSGDV